ISIRKVTKRGPTFIRSRNLEWPSVAGAFISRTVASIATANRCAPITPLPISIAREMLLQVRRQNGVTAAAHRAITSSIGQRCLVKREWVLIWPTSAKPPRPRKKPRQHNQVLRIRPRPMRRHPRPTPHLRPRTPPHNKTPSRLRNHPLHLQLRRPR